MAVAIPLTTEAEMDDEVGKDAILAWADHDNSGLANDGVLTRVIDRATQEILRTAGNRYSATALSGDAEIRGWATILACYFLAKTRGNHPPDSLVDDVEWIRENLKSIEDGRSTLNRVAMKADLRPTMTNRTVDRRYSFRTVRKRPDSTGPNSVIRDDRVTYSEEV